MAKLGLQIRPTAEGVHRVRGLCNTPAHRYPPTVYPPNNLNPSQLAAWTSAKDNRLTLVQGPPGTGKTSCSVEILRMWVQTRKFSGILACSDSNIAVDNILAGLIKCGVRAVRLGRPENTRPDLLRHSIDEMISMHTDPQEKHKARTRIIGQADIICCTCVGAGSGVISDKKSKRVRQLRHHF